MGNAEYMGVSSSSQPGPPSIMTKRTRKAGVTGKYGVRYGATLRKSIKKMEITQHATYTCTFCGKDSVKRKNLNLTSAFKSNCSKKSQRFQGLCFSLSRKYCHHWLRIVNGLKCIVCVLKSESYNFEVGNQRIKFVQI